MSAPTQPVVETPAELAALDVATTDAATALRRMVDHLDLCLGADPKGVFEITCNSGGRPTIKFFDVADKDEAAHFVLAMRKTHNVYLAAATQPAAPSSGRGKSTGVNRLSIVTLDYDCAWGVHAEPNLPRRLEQFDELLAKAGAPPPTTVVSTGGGLLGIWAIATPLEIHTENDRKEATRLSKGFQAHLIKTAATLGYKVDSTGDLVRLTRLPETFNLKTDPPRSVRTWRGGGPQLVLSELRRIADLGLPVTAAAPPRPSSSDDDAVGGGVAKVESIRAGCRFIAHAFDDAAALPEPEWKAAIDVVAFCEDGPVWVHRMSENHSRYDRQETEAKIAASLKVAPRTCQAIAKDLGFEGCRRCPYRTQINSPIALGHRSKQLAELGSQFVYLTEPQLFVKTDNIT
jgi:hypothetical protein